MCTSTLAALQWTCEGQKLVLLRFVCPSRLSALGARVADAERALCGSSTHRRVGACWLRATSQPSTLVLFLTQICSPIKSGFKCRRQDLSSFCSARTNYRFMRIHSPPLKNPSISEPLGISASVFLPFARSAMNLLRSSKPHFPHSLALSINQKSTVLLRIMEFAVPYKFMIPENG